MLIWNFGTVLKLEKLNGTSSTLFFINKEKKRIREKNVFVSLFNVINDINIITTI